MENTQVGPFLVIKKLGAHRRHNVYLARQTEQDRDVAMKFIKLPPQVDRDKALMKINREVQVVKQLKHKNLVQMYGAGVHEEHVFFAHELVEGEALSAILGRRSRLAIDQVIDYGAQIATGLEFLHQNEIVHTKLTADKILIEPDGGLKIADLRLNRSRKRRWDAARRASLEIAAYMAPEQLLGDGATAKSDIYSLGVLLFEMLTGQLPFEPQTMAQLARDKQKGNCKRVAESVMSCPSWLDQLVTRMISPDPKLRPHSAHAVLLTLEQIRAVDQAGKAVAVEMTRGFSALTAGMDKTEARRVLGHKPVKEVKEAGPLLQSLPFLIGGLMMVSSMIALFVFWPFATDRQEMMTRANLLLASTSQSDWREARKLYEKIMASSNEELANEAEEKYYLSRRKTLIYRLENELLQGPHPEIREFKRGFQMQKDGRLDEAIAMFQQFVESYDTQNELIYVRDEARDRLQHLIAARQQANDVRESVNTQLTEAEALAGAPESLGKAREIWTEISDKYSENEFLKTEVTRAKVELVSRPAAETAEPAEEGAGETETADAQPKEDENTGQGESTVDEDNDTGEFSQ